jgi:dolichyl-phosphate-mannose--protein O-mannosyl transferase
MFFTLLAAYALFTRHHIFSAISLGLASATKWSGLYYIVAFFLWALYLDYLQERAIENQTPIKSALQAALPKRLAQYGLITVATYVASWSGWFFTNNGWDRNWSNKSWGIVPAVLRNFWHYHAEILGFHQNLHDRHPYMSNPWSWLIQGRPTSFFYATPKGCGGGNCSREVLALGTPLIWWSAIFAIFVLIGYAISKRDQIAQFILLLIGAGWLPWFTFQKRTMFTFYTIAFEPFIILAVVYAIARATGGPQLSISKNEIKWRWRLVLIYLIAVALCFAYFAPLYFGNTIAYHDWYAKMWFPSWI